MQLPVPYLKNLLYIFKHSRDKAFLEKHAEEIFLDFQEYSKTAEGKEFLQELFVYFMEMLDLPSHKVEEKMVQILPRTLQSTTMGTMTKWGIHWKNIGIQSGLEKGREEGLEKGLEKAVMSLIQKFPDKTDKEIADWLGTEETFVAKARKKLLEPPTDEPEAILKKKPAAARKKVATSARSTKKKPVQ